MTYDPVQGTGWDREQAGRLWSASLARSAPVWQLHGQPGAWYWAYFNFRPYTGRVSVEDDGFRWQTADYDTGTIIHSGLTTSVYVAFQSVVQNRADITVPPVTGHHEGKQETDTA